MYSDPGAEGYVVHDGDTSNTPGTPKDPEVYATDPKLMFSITEKAIDFIEDHFVSRLQPTSHRPSPQTNDSGFQASFVLLPKALKRHSHAAAFDVVADRVILGVFTCFRRIGWTW